LGLSLASAQVARQAAVPGVIEDRSALSLRRKLSILAGFLVLALLLQYLCGTYRRELGGAPDEAAHFITGLMIHDYVSSGMKSAPVDYAQAYYAHYPKVAFGVWPPLFHVAEAAWMLLVFPSKASVFLMLAGITAILAYLLFRTVERLYGSAAGLCAGVLLLSTPLMQQSTVMVMVDSTVALFSFLAMLRFARYIDGGRWQDAALFAIWASAAILSKYNGAALALVPPLCAALTRRWPLFWSRASLLAAGIVLVICGAWYLPMSHLVAYAAEPLPSLGTLLPSAQINVAALGVVLGMPALLVVAIGVAFTVRRGAAARFKDRGVWVSGAAMIGGYFLFHSVVTPDPEPRYLLPVLPVMILFLAAGVEGLSRWLRLRPLLVAAAVAVLYVAGSFRLMRMPHIGYAEVAASIASRQAPDQKVVLVAGSAENEGMAVSEIALRERRPHHYVLRASKLLARSSWMGARYRSLHQTPVEVLQALDEAGVSAVIVQANTPGDMLHHRLLDKALRSAAETWERWVEAGWQQSEKYFHVYRRIRPMQGTFCVEVSLEETLHRALRECISGETAARP
jgi:hypothetical protein